MVDSPCGRFTCETTRFSEYPPELSQTTFIKKRGEPGYSRGLVREKETGRTIAEFKRESFLFHPVWVDHPNGNQYLLCTEDAEGYSVVNLTSGMTHRHRPSGGDPGLSLMWCNVYPSPDKTRLAVFDYSFSDSPAGAPCCALFDFRSPDSLPYPELARAPCGNYPFELMGADDDRRNGWRDNETFVFLTQFVYRKTDGLPFDMLTEDEPEGNQIGIRVERVILQPGREPAIRG